MRDEDGIVKPSIFEGFRFEGFPTLYDENKTPAHVDVVEAGIITAFVLVGFSFLLMLPAFRGLTRAKVIVRISVSIVIGAIISTSNFGQRWEVGWVETHAPYKPGFGEEVKMEVGLLLGLRAVNVTLRAKEDVPHSFKDEIIDYNEHFTWAWDQGRFGFGPYAGRIQREFRQAQRTGLPLPILWVIDYFTLDGEGYRFGRFYRTAGWYAHIALWAALPSWLLAVFLLHTAVLYGAILTGLTGFLQLLACFLWSVIRNPEPLFIPFEDGDIKLKFGIDFWITLANGFLCLFLGMLILILDLRFPNETQLFFGIDPLTVYEEHYITSEEYKAVQLQTSSGGLTDGNMELGNVGQDQEAANLRHLAATDDGQTHVILKRRTTLRHAQKSHIRAPGVPGQIRPPPRRLPPVPQEEDEQPIYSNLGADLRDQPSSSNRYMHH